MSEPRSKGLLATVLVAVGLLVTTTSGVCTAGFSILFLAFSGEAEGRAYAIAFTIAALALGLPFVTLGLALLGLGWRSRLRSGWAPDKRVRTAARVLAAILALIAVLSLGMIAFLISDGGGEAAAFALYPATVAIVAAWVAAMFWRMRR